MADEPSYKSAVAAAEAQRIAAIEAVRARLAVPTALFDRVVERYMDRLHDCSVILRRADSAKPRFNAWDHNDKQRIYAIERAQKGRLIFRLLNPQINDGTEEYEFTSLQIFDPYHDPEKVGAPVSVYPRRDFRPIGQRKSVGEGSDCFAVVIPWIQSYEFQISLRARLGEKLPPRSFPGGLFSVGAALFGLLITIGPIALICYVVWSWLN